MAVQPPNRTIFLVGMMGAGKSTIGKALAALMGTKFVDLDRELEERCGVSIPHIFETEGEAGIEELCDLAPVHNAGHLKGIRAVDSLMPANSIGQED